MAAKTMQDLFVHMLSDIYSAEKQLAKALPKFAHAATSAKLTAAFEFHLEETHNQIDRIDQIVESSGLKLRRMKCAAMDGLVEEGKDVVDEIQKGPVLDAALIAAAQKIEHYEIASYGTLCTFAKLMRHDEALRLMKETMAEEKATDEKLTMLAQTESNLEAANAVETSRS
jgi:ferritin-like metal-binding protein YciE